MFSYLLFRCEAEEQAEYGQGAYDLPNYGKLVYCGLQGVRPILKRIQETNDLGHPLCSNLREGTWLCDYIIGRLKRPPQLEGVAKIFEHSLSLLAKGVPHFLRPCYFELLFTYLYGAVERVALEKIFVQSPLPRLEITERLTLSSLSFLASIPSAKLPPIQNMMMMEEGEAPSLAAGLPHFAEGIWRNWGRDTFIALPGTLLLSGRFSEAKNILLAYAGTLRHGLIPNLLAEGKIPRYNCRDAVWFWLVASLRYVEMAPEGEEILKAEVLRLYPQDNSEYRAIEKVEPLYDTMYEALQRHFNTINFRERNAGHQIDEHMATEGFNVTARIDHSTGLIFGGNQWNCGTWMDKMGSSERAGNKGIPATPRDGAAVELQGLALFVAERLDELSHKGKFPHAQMQGAEGIAWSWKEWAQKIRQSFGPHFFVDDENKDQYVHRQGIVKDSFGSTGGFTDFQLRPNFCIALDVVPDILEAEKGWRALEVAGEILGAPLGIKTLDDKDWAYNPYYNNDDDGTNKQTAKGWNYHQGPEWLWVAALYLSAKLKVAHRLGGEKWSSALDEVKGKIQRYSRHLRESAWCSLPELTNKDGAFCSGACPAQAWSVGCFLDALHTMDTLMGKGKE